MTQGSVHVPTLITRAKVVGFSCAGFNQTQIAQYLDICENTLVKHYAYELVNARMERLEGVSDTAYKRAMDGNDRMIELICSTQLRWVKPKANEETEKDKAAGALMEKLIDKL